jgi:hypothetical protein
MPITEAAKAHLAKLAERGAQAPKKAKTTKKATKKAEEVVVEEAVVEETVAEETPTEGE